MVIPYRGMGVQAHAKWSKIIPAPAETQQTLHLATIASQSLFKFSQLQKIFLRILSTSQYNLFQAWQLWVLLTSAAYSPLIFRVWWWHSTIKTMEHWPLRQLIMKAFSLPQHHSLSPLPVRVTQGGCSHQLQYFHRLLQQPSSSQLTLKIMWQPIFMSLLFTALFGFRISWLQCWCISLLPLYCFHSLPRSSSEFKLWESFRLLSSDYWSSTMFSLCWRL